MPSDDASESRGAAADPDRDDEGHHHERLPPAEAWEQFGSVLYCYVLEEIRHAADDALAELATDVRDGRRPTAEEIREARRALDRARELVEEHYAPLAAEERPWSGGVGQRVPYGVLREQLEASGYTVRRDDRP